MHETLIGVIEKSELAVSSVRDLVDPDRLQVWADLIADARARLGHPDDLLVVALAGGTGSGKSSIFNALTGTDAAGTGAIRPTTAQPMAAVPSDRGPALDGLLDRLGIAHRIEAVGFGHCLIDLPDTDSVVLEHRHRVEEVMPRVDIVVWVVDPEKYRDRALHHRYLRPLSDYARQFVVVLNQVDRLDPARSQEVLDDLATALAEDGMPGVPVVACAADPPGQPSWGVERLRETIEVLGGDRHLLYRKLLVDLERAAVDLSGKLGSGIGYRDRVSPVLAQAAALIADDDEAGAVAVMTAFYEGLATEVGGEVGHRLADFANGIPNLVDHVVGSRVEPRRPWWRRRPPVVDESAVVQARLEAATRPVDAVLTARARGIAAAADMLVAVRSALRGPP